MLSGMPTYIFLSVDRIQTLTVGTHLRHYGLKEIWSYFRVLPLSKPVKCFIVINNGTK